ncbi:hypothetical protein ACIOD2_27510 [Amycolatopsis sp. NPDC088138]|uniref:hypothetical protein n=1 Tax=Amycolatopsis sp. NPDC088138 TaxID=3363938 RepID=UPI00382C8188
MAAAGVDLLGLRSVVEAVALRYELMVTREAKPRRSRTSPFGEHRVPSTVIPYPKQFITHQNGTGKTEYLWQILQEILHRTPALAPLLTASGPDATESNAPKPCDCPACAELTATASCLGSPDRLDSRLNFESWKTDPAGFAAPHVAALMNVPALEIAAVLDDWAGDIFDRAHRDTGECSYPVHLILPWILLLHRLLILSWRSGAAQASRVGLDRIRRRSRDLHPPGEVKSRPRCAGRAPRGPSAPRMSSSLVIRGGVVR